MSIPIDPVPRLYVYVSCPFLFDSLTESDGFRYVLWAKVIHSKYKNKGFEEKNPQIPHFLTFRPIIHQGTPQMTLLCQQASYPKSKGSAHRFPVPT